MICPVICTLAQKKEEVRLQDFLNELEDIIVDTSSPSESISDLKSIWTKRIVYSAEVVKVDIVSMHGLLLW